MQNRRQINTCQKLKMEFDDDYDYDSNFNADEKHQINYSNDFQSNGLNEKDWLSYITTVFPVVLIVMMIFRFMDDFFTNVLIAVRIGIYSLCIRLTVLILVRSRDYR